jgi:hypothetical protein
VLIALLTGFMALLTMTRRDAWPITRYPMFSGYRRIGDVRVLCLALETADGSLRWWRPHFYRYTDGIRYLLGDGTEEQAVPCVEHVMRLLALEYKDVSWCTAVHVVERTWLNGVPLDRAKCSIPVLGGGYSRDF